MNDRSNPGGAAEIRPDILFKDLAGDGGDKPALNDMESVDGIVRAFGVRLIDYRRQYLETGKAPGDGVEAFVEAQSEAMARIFLGEDDDYAATAWNSPEQLGVSLGERAGISGEPREVVEAFFVRLASDLLGLAIDMEDGKASDPQFQLDVLIEEAVYALLGLPLSAA